MIEPRLKKLEAIADMPTAEAAVRDAVLLLKRVMIPDCLDTTDIRVRAGQRASMGLLSSTATGSRRRAYDVSAI